MAQWYARTYNEIQDRMLAAANGARRWMPWHNHAMNRSRVGPSIRMEPQIPRPGYRERYLGYCSNTMTDHQPNFDALFYETFGPGSHPIQYAIRQGPNCVHDLIFVSSLTHDARILNPDVKPNSDRLEIHLNRDCWELGDTVVEGYKELHLADSKLCFTAVKSVQWHFAKPLTHEPWLDYLWIDRERSYDPDAPFTFYLVGFHWKCTVSMNADDWTIELNDTELPYLWSTRNPQITNG